MVVIIIIKSKIYTHVDWWVTQDVTEVLPQINKYNKYAIQRASLSLLHDNPNLNVRCSARVGWVGLMGPYPSEKAASKRNNIGQIFRIKIITSWFIGAFCFYKMHEVNA